ncbi:MAG: glycosyltransferase [Desulfuromonadaceae bacterium]|nr:glycosyltransferase [Desulfuromonadaceae bacterium]MDD5104909.1 glycosyltransferase [Desulfuromonadaceae bacterium]
MSEKISTTVIVTSYNQPYLLGKALRSIASQSLFPDEVIVADDGSREEVFLFLKSIAKTLPYKLRFVTHPDIGFRLSKTRNNAIRAARGDLLIFTDQDILFTRGYIENFVINARKGYFLVSWPVRLTEKQSNSITPMMIEGCDYSNVVTDEQISDMLRQYRKDTFYRFLYALKLRRIGPKLRGGVCAIFKNDLLSVNGYDEKYQGWGNEDDDMGRRLYAYGLKGMNVTREELPLHLHHPVNHGGTRPNKEYYLKRLKAIGNKNYTCADGVNTPLGGDQSRVFEFDGS